MSEVLTYEHPKVGTQSAPVDSPLALALASEEDWELIEGTEPEAADESKDPSDEEHDAEVAAQAEIEAELSDSE